MAPCVGVPLQHDLLGRILRIEIDVSEELIAGADAKAGLSVNEHVLPESGRRELDRFGAAVYGMRRLADEVPRQIYAAAGLRPGPRGQTIFDPHIFAARQRLRRRGVE